jgi:hypothetical protein
MLKPKISNPFSFQKPIAKPGVLKPATTEASAIPATAHNPENGWDDAYALTVRDGQQWGAQAQDLPDPMNPPAPFAPQGKPPGSPPPGIEPKTN